MKVPSLVGLAFLRARQTSNATRSRTVKIHQRGVQWKQGVAMYMLLYVSLLYDTTPFHCTPLPLHPPVMNTHAGAH